MKRQTRFLIVALVLTIFSLTVLPAVSAQDEVGNPVVAYITQPVPTRSFAVTDQNMPIIGTVIFDPAIMKYWKVDIRGTSTRSFIGADLFDRTLAFDWVTIGSTRTDTVIDDILAVVPGWPGLSLGNWQVRLVVVGLDDTFLMEPITIPFTLNVPTRDPVTVNITQPDPGSILRDTNSVLGTIQMNRFATAYRLELLGGDYTEWTVVDSYTSDTGHPIIVTNGEIGRLPDLAQLEPGRYRLRVIVVGWDANYLQSPYEVDFAVGTNRVSNLASIQVSAPQVSNGRITIREGAPLMGTVVVPQGAQYYKVELKDDIRAGQAQASRFTDWTTLNEVHAQSVTDGQIEYLPASPDLLPGNYRLRVVVIGANGGFATEPFEVGLTVQAPPA
jgi:hypothetical protein